MNFLTPTVAAIAGAIALPTLLILYFLKLRRKNVEISTTLLWRKAVQDMQANAPFQKLRRNILLFLQLLALAGIVLAVAQPLSQDRRPTGKRHVILIDRSASMASLDGDGKAAGTVTRIDEAKRQALALVDALPEGSQFVATTAADQAMVIAFDKGAEPLVPFTSNKAELRSAIESIQPVHTPSALRLAVSTAVANLPKRILSETGQAIDGLQGGEPIAMHLFSDGRLPDAGEAKPGADNEFIFHAIGSPTASNAGIVQLQAERDYTTPAKVSIYVGLQSTYESERIADVELLLNGQVARIESITLPPAGEVRLSGVSGINEANRAKELAEAVRDSGEGAGTAGDSSPQQSRQPSVAGTVFRIEDADAMLVGVRLRSPATGERMVDDVLESDDRAWLMVPPARRLSVAVVGRKNMFLSDALAGLPLSQLDFLSVEDFDKAYAEGRAGQWDVVILDNVLPQVARSKQGGSEGVSSEPTLPLGNYLVLGKVPGGLGIIDKGASGPGTIVDWSRDHPVTGRVLLDSLQIASTREVSVEPGRGVVTLATAERGPAILEINQDDTHALIVPFDYMESNWPFSQWFVAFVGLATDHLGREVTGSIDARGLGALTELRDRVPMGAADVRIRHPDGTTASIQPSPNGSFVYRLPAQLGVYELVWNGQPLGGDLVLPDGSVLRKFAANLLDPLESDVPSATEVSLASVKATATGGAVSGGALQMRELWPYVLLFVVALLLLEWYIYNRKVQL